MAGCPHRRLLQGGCHRRTRRGAIQRHTLDRSSRPGWGRPTTCTTKASHREIITVGGKQDGDLYTEAAAGKNYLIDRGVPADRILAVETGSDTLQSIEAVSAAMRGQGSRSVVLVSDPWHSLRTRTMARDAGFDAWTAPTRTGPAVYTRESQSHGIASETGALLWYQLTHFSADFTYTAGQ